MNACKRTRSASDAEDSSDESASTSNGERHPSLWLEDGNIIISARSTVTGKTLLYRVHKSLLARQSDVFAGLFALPDTPANYASGGPDDVNNVPVVHLPDQAEGVTDLLNVLYNPLESQLFTRKRHPDFPVTALRLVNLADKYNIDVLKRAIISRLSADWPKSLDEWEATDVRFQMHTNEFSHELISRSNWPEDLLPEPVSAAILANELQVKDVLTAIYLDMYRVSRDVEWDTAPPQSITIEGKGARWSMANAEQLRKLVMVQNIIEKNLKEETPSLFLDEDDSENLNICSTSASGTCQRLLSDKRHQFTLRLWERRDPLEAFDEVCRWSKESKLCEFCRALVEDRATETRMMIWFKIENMVCSS